MADEESLKVYELAKELGCDSISLVDKLRDLKIIVKSHMSSLTPEQTEAARTALGKPDTKKKKAAAPKKATKAAPVRRKAVTAEAVEPAAAKPASEKPKAPKAEAQAEVDAEGKSSSKIIRRRRSGEHALPEESFVVSGSSGAESAESYEEDAADGEYVAYSDEVTFTEAEGATYTDAEESFEGTEEVHASSPAGSVDHLESEAPPHSPTESSLGAAPASPENLSPQAAERRSFLNIVQNRPAPKRPAIRQIVKPAAEKPIRPKGPTPITPRDPSEIKNDPRQGSRVFKMTKEALDRMAEEEASRKKPGTGTTKGDKPEDVRFADYRKKEVVFLPKRKKIPTGKETKKTQITTPAAHKRVVEMGEAISVQDFSNQLGMKAVEVIRKLISMGQMATINQSLDFDTATLIANEFGYEVKNISFKEETLIGATADQDEDLTSRPPIVTVMGHVDHGKTSLLDAIRDSNVVAGEAGGITQHIGAYTISKNDKLITFIDTPGHEAFTVMRERGANVTDIVVLVVAADDGVMPQTREAVSHAKAAQVPIIVAVNKIDKPGANPEKVKQVLSEIDVLAEDWGGQSIFVPVSAKQKTNIDQLLEAILLTAEVQELKANSKAKAKGTVLEARLEKGKGPVASLIVTRGTLKIGDNVATGQVYGRIKAMMDHRGVAIKEVSPGMAAEVLGFEDVPSAGDPFDVTDSETDARKIVDHRKQVILTQKMSGQTRASLEDLFAKIQEGGAKELKIVLKADVFGSVEAVKDSLLKTSTDRVKVTIIHAAPGGITESDVLLASASDAVIIGFNVRPETKARQIAEARGIQVKTYKIIYELIDDVKKAMGGLLEKKQVEKFLGRAEVRQIFSVPKIGVIAGTSVIDGKMVRGSQIRLLRDSKVIYEGKMGSLRRFKDDAKEVNQGYECGIGIENYNDLKPGDLIEAFEIEYIAQEL